MSAAARRIAGDWYDAPVPDNVELDGQAYVESAYSFRLFRSRREPGAALAEGAAAYLGTMFDVGPGGQVRVGRCAMLNGVRLICDAAIEIGAYALLSWNVVIMDSYRLPRNAAARRAALRQAGPFEPPHADVEPRPVSVGANVWVGFDAVVLPGVSIGDGAVVGARSVVWADVPPFTVVAGNPAVVVRELEP